MRALFVSPHADDICLSLAGVAAGMVVPKHLLTVFSESVWAEPSWHGSRSVAALSSARTTEDRRFCSLLGFTYHSSGLPDSSIRHGLDGNLRNPSGDEADLQARAERHIRRLVDEIGFQVLLGPMGLGGHADHIVCHRAVRSVAEEAGVSVVFYEDLPYAGEMRLHAISRCARRIDKTLAPVVCRTRVPVEEKIGMARMYETQQDKGNLEAVAEHSGRLESKSPRGMGTRGGSQRIPFEEDAPGAYTVERLWTRESVARLSGLLGPSLEVGPGRRRAFLGRG